jgi:phosphoribosyl 1,2-cyclic phosphodiesterase
VEVILRGVRGSIANASADTAFYGGNTSCAELRADCGALLFFDAGTGIREAGENLPKSGECHIFISHGHADHILGLWFFRPLHLPSWTVHLYLPLWMKGLPDYIYECAFFPMPFSELKGDVRLKLLEPGQVLSIPTPSGPDIAVETTAMNHPGGGLGYRVRVDDALFAYSGDHEIVNGRAREAADFLAGADIALVDAMYGREDYHPGWGHSCWEDWVEAAREAKVRNLVLTHHDPIRSDQALDRLDATLVSLNGGGEPKAYIAREGMRITPKGPIPFTRQGSDWLLLFLEELARYRDESVVLDRILFKAREITHADAGTIYLAEGDELVFAYTHNDSLFSVDSAHKHIYSNIRIRIAQSSIAGYVAATGKPLNIADAYRLPSGLPYSFNDSFDRSSGYVTTSLLVLPFFDNVGKLSGVLQLINSIDPQTEKPCPFGMNMVYSVRLLAREAAGVLQHSALERKSVYGILRMAAVHDPTETGPHAERVGAISAELYHLWARRAGHGMDAIRYEKSRIRLAAMLHDIGKVGISDLILKKPGRLTEEEIEVMKGHTSLGASILAGDGGEIAAYAHDIALHHHQRWDGKGYAGPDEPLAGEDIPLSARITAIADTFDALVSHRCYKAPWTHGEALAFLRDEAGTRFDPLLVDLLFEMRDLLGPIYERFSETPPK